MRPVLTLLAAAAAVLAVSDATQAQQRYLTWPGKVDQPAAASTTMAPAGQPRLAPPMAAPMASTPMAGDRYGPRRSTFPQPPYARQPEPQPAPQPAAYAPRPAPSPYPPTRTAAPAPRRPTIYDPAPLADTPRRPIDAPRDVAMAAPAPEPMPEPVGEPAPQPAPAPQAAPPPARQPWAGATDAQAAGSRRYSVQREVAETTWGPEVAARYANPAPAPQPGR